VVRQQTPQAAVRFVRFLTRSEPKVGLSRPGRTEARNRSLLRQSVCLDKKVRSDESPFLIFIFLAIRSSDNRKRDQISDQTMCSPRGMQMARESRMAGCDWMDGGECSRWRWMFAMEVDVLDGVECAMEVDVLDGVGCAMEVDVRWRWMFD